VADAFPSIEVEDISPTNTQLSPSGVIRMPDEELGETIKALVDVREGHAADEADLIVSARSPEWLHFKRRNRSEYRLQLALHGSGKLQKVKVAVALLEGPRGGRERMRDVCLTFPTGLDPSQRETCV